MRILLVEDEADLSGVIAKFLQQHGHEVVAAPDAIRAVEFLEHRDFDLIITDLMMPHMDGIAFARRVRSEPRYLSIPIIMITAYDDEATFDEGLRKGVAFVLKKPLDFDRLLSLVQFAQ